MNNDEITQPRWKSWAVWVSVASAAWMVLSAFGLTEKWGILPETWNDILNAIGVILCGFGILNNPTNKYHF